MEKKIAMEFEPKLVKAIFVERLNRFAAAVEIEGKIATAHVPSSGRLKELLVPGANVWIQPASGPKRKTAFTLEIVQAGNGTLVSIDTGTTNRLVKLALLNKAIRQFQHCSDVKPESVYRSSRLDFAIDCEGTRTWIEVKSVTLVRDGVALFPDAPTDRGRRHMAELEHIARSGEGACALFLIQRDDANRFAPNIDQDPAFASALASAARAGVRILAFSCKVTPNSIAANFGKDVPVEIPT